MPEAVTEWTPGPRHALLTAERNKLSPQELASERFAWLEAELAAIINDHSEPCEECGGIGEVVRGELIFACRKCGGNGYAK